jgi:hypothetical protein
MLPAATPTSREPPLRTIAPISGSPSTCFPIWYSAFASWRSIVRTLVPSSRAISG